MRDVRLVVDGRPLVGPRSGIGVHVAEIVSRLELGVAPTIASHEEISSDPILDERTTRTVYNSRPGVWWQQRHLPRLATELDADVVWGPHGTLPLMLRQPAVVTVHDLTSLDMPGRHKVRTVLSFNTLIGPSLEKASSIVAVSKNTAEQVTRRFGISSAKIEVVYNGVSDFFSPGNAESPDLPVEDFILYVGTLEPRKGIEVLVEAWTELPGPRPKLILCGATGWGSEKLLRSLANVPDVIRTGWVSPETLRDLYRTSLFTVYPSMFEGFGLPVVEAMKCGSPVITTTGGAIPEVAGDAAVSIDPGDRRALTDSMSRLLGSEDLRAELRERGLVQSAKFSWSKAASSFESIFRAVAADG